MSYRWIVFILLASSAATVALAIWKTFSWRSDKLSWFAVPYPLLLATAYLALPYIRLVLIWR